MAIQSKTPLLFFLGELSGETKHAIFDPIQKTLNSVHYPELECQTECLSSGHGWILMLSRETRSLFFLNPCTHQRYNLPYRNSIYSAVAFSAPPTSPDCTVYVVQSSTFNGQTTIDSLRVRDKRWTRHVYIGNPKDFNIVEQVICCNGFLYCVDSRGRIAVFDNKNGSWTIIPCKRRDKTVFHAYLVHYNGEIFAAKKGRVVEKVHKLNLKDGVADWVEVRDLDGVKLFFGPYGGCAVLSQVEGRMENEIFVAREKPESKCVIYGFDGGECDMDTRFDVTPYSWWYAPIWIDRNQ